MRKGFAAILVLGVITAVLVLGGAFYLKQKKSTNVSTQITAVQDSSWKTYTSNVGGYSFEYPSNWFVSEKNDGDHTVTLSSADISGVTLKDKVDATSITIKTNNGNTTLDGMAAIANNTTTGASSSTKQDTILGGEKAIIFKSSLKDPTNKSNQSINETLIVSQKGSLSVLINSFYLDNANIDDTIEHLRSSFKFLTPTRVPSDISQLKSKLDKYKATDLFNDQAELEVYKRSVDVYPQDFTQLIGQFNQTHESTDHVYTTDPQGNPYQYQLLDGGKDYQLSVKLDDGSTYTVYGSTLQSESPEDVHRLSDLSQLSFALSAYYQEHSNLFPNKVTDLLPNDLKIVPKDPVTSSNYYYIPVDGNTNYELSTTLDNGFIVFYRAKRLLPK